jgi:glycine dehydrogenase subunit 2
MDEPLLCELSAQGRMGIQFPEPDVPLSELPDQFLRGNLPLPEISEVDAIRHFTRISQLNFCIDTGIYPLGSCTMKYNPKVNEEMARLDGFSNIHPLQPRETIQGSLEIMYQLQEYLKEIGGFAGVSLQPAAGAQGELTGILIIRSYHIARGQPNRNKVLIPDSAHGTNPASSAMSGMEVVQIPSDSRGNLSLDALEAECDENLAGLMLTNPNTLGLFDENVIEAINLIHASGGLVYGDGANLNALLGIVRPGDLGIDVMHFNLHKTFSTPHGGGGPGSGPVGVLTHLVEFLPTPIVSIDQGDMDGSHVKYTFYHPAQSIGRVKSFHGQFGMFIRAYTYIRMHGPQGLRKVSEHAVLNSNYLLHLLKDIYPLPYQRNCMHEFVLEGKILETPEVHAIDIAKRLMDYGMHPPTYYFPLIVSEALMIEPTETESKQSLDYFANAMKSIRDEARLDPSILKSAPHTTPVGRLNEVKAAKDLILSCSVGNQPC